MIHDPVLSPVRTRCETRVANSVGLLKRVLVEDAALVVLAPVLGIHGIRSNKLKLSEAIVAVVGAGGGVNYECLVCVWVRQLFWALVR